MKGRHCPNAGNGDNSSPSVGLMMNTTVRSFEELQQDAERRWQCHCGYVEVSDKPHELRRMAKKHRERCGVTV
jgi:hypothetical protein